MTIPNAKPGYGGAQRVDQSEVLYSPQNQSKPAQQMPQQQPGRNSSDWFRRLYNRSRPNVQGGAQDMASRILPSFNNGNPMGANNLPFDPQDFFTGRQNQRQGNRPPSEPRYEGEMPVYNPDGATPGFNLGDYIGGVGNRPVLPNFEDQPVDSARLAEMIRQYNTEWRGQNVDPYSLDRYAPPIRSTEANQRMIDYFSNELRQADPRNPPNTQGTGYQGSQGEWYTTMPVPRAPMGGDPNYFGGQSPGAGRYRPPTMDGRGQWQDGGGYNYNLPNAFGSYPGYGQGNPWSQRMGPGYGSMFDFMPQFLPMQPFGG